MKAAVYHRREPEKIAIEEVQKPAIGEQNVLVRIHAASANALDYRSIRMGITRDGRVIGADIAGTVEAVGSGAARFKPGDAVFGDIFKYAGGFAEYAAVPEEALALIPPGVTFEQAAALPVAALTALQALRGWGGVVSGQQVMILGAGGGVGMFAVQLARQLGGEVTAVCGAANLPLAENLGAKRVIDYSRGDVFSGDAQYDRIVAVNGSYPIHVMRRMLKSGGVLVVVGGALRQIFKAMVLGPFAPVKLLSAKPNAAELEYLAGLVQAGRLKPVIDRRYALAEAAEAVRYLEQGHARGKVILTVIPGETVT
jgi:NADPH:quinone reductase-like Zn-dependent oxidoreductase